MPHTVEIYSEGDETALLAAGTLEDAVQESDGEYRSHLRPLSDLQAGFYVLRFTSGERWHVETLHAPDPSPSRPFSGPWVIVVSHQPRPI